MKRSLTTACCGDRRLNRLITLLDGNQSYRKRDLGTPFDFTIDQGALLVWHAKLTGFPKEEAPISDALILVHTDCLAIQKNAFFATLREKRCARFPMTSDGELGFCRLQLDRIKAQADRLQGDIAIRWHYGIIDTARALGLRSTSTIRDAVACIQWPYGPPPFFQEHVSTPQEREPTLIPA